MLMPVTSAIIIEERPGHSPRALTTISRLSRQETIRTFADESEARDWLATNAQAHVDYAIYNQSAKVRLQMQLSNVG